MKAGSNATEQRKQVNTMNIRKITAALSAATLFPFSASIIPLSANAFSSDPDSDEYAPEWVPDDLESAIKFSNTYGAAHFENGYLCIVFPEDIMTGPADSIGKERYSFETEGNAMLEVGRKKILGRMAKDFNVQVYRAWGTGDFEVSVIDTWAQPADPDKGITISGYADKGTGNAEVNAGYAKARAEKVAQTLQKKGVDKKRMTVKSYGDTVQPYAKNDDNRCVIVVGQ